MGLAWLCSLLCFALLCSSFVAMCKIPLYLQLAAMSACEGFYSVLSLMCTRRLPTSSCCQNCGAVLGAAAASAGVPTTPS